MAECLKNSAAADKKLGGDRIPGESEILESDTYRYREPSTRPAAYFRKNPAPNANDEKLDLGAYEEEVLGNVRSEKKSSTYKPSRTVECAQLNTVDKSTSSNMSEASTNGKAKADVISQRVRVRRSRTTTTRRIQGKKPNHHGQKLFSRNPPIQPLD